MPAAIVFDLDGTLIDSRRDLATAINRLRAELGMLPLPVEAVIPARPDELAGIAADLRCREPQDLLNALAP